jgi:hypothetical protein
MWKALDPTHLWSQGQSSSGKVQKTYVVVHLPNSQLGQVFNLLQLTPCPRGPIGVGMALGPQLGKTFVKQKL